MSLPAGLGQLDPFWAIGYAAAMLEMGDPDKALVALTLARPVVTYSDRQRDEEKVA